MLDPARTYVDQAIAVVDFASLYPSIIAATGAGERLALPRIVRELMHERRSTRNPTLARAYKIAANSVYGQLASPVSPMYDPEAANAVTAEGRARLNSLVAHLVGDGGEVIYGDTDSCLVVFAQHAGVDACKAKADRSIEAFNSTLPNPMRVTVQEVFLRGVFLSKKKYIGVTPDGALKYTGTVNVRADTPAAVRDAYESIASRVLGGTEGEMSADTVRASIEAAHRALVSEPKDRCCAVRKLSSLDKSTETIPAHIELARRENFREDGSYTTADSIEFAPCTPLPSERWRTRGNVVCEASGDDLARSVQRSALWHLYASATSDLVTSVLGAEAGRVCSDTCSSTCAEAASTAQR